MLRYTLGRLGVGLAQLFVVATGVFVLTEALPGDAAVVAAGDVPDPARIAAIRHALGLDLPPWDRYVGWLGDLAAGDLGTSLVTGRPVADVLGQAIAPTAVLAGVTLAVLLPLSLLLGVLAALKEGGRLDRAISAVTVALHAVPEYALAVLLVAVFALWLGVLPATAVGGSLTETPVLLVLPVTVLAARSAASLVRLVRAGMVDALASEYVAHVRRHGLAPWRVVLRHALPNALVPAVQQLARTVDWLFGGIVVVEAVFAVPGLAAAIVDAVSGRDIPVVQAATVLVGAVVICVNLAADLAAHRLTPRAGVAR
ncbi:ABC transporter permease [Longispora sp. NPDC051575]|uniref:ABC transporter permease n=1 Tax=Longispora sp. NPDC051575 TaxID=3154943 RepID=UPI00342FA423